MPSPPPPPPPPPTLPPETVVKTRFLSLLIWQSVSSTTIYLLFKTLTPSPLTTTTAHKILLSLFSFTTFLLSNLLFSSAIVTISSPHQAPPAPLLLLLRRRLFGSSFASPPDLPLQVRVSLSFALFPVAAGLSGLVSVASLCGGGWFGRAGFRGFLCGFMFGLVYVYKNRWVLKFPIVQRPLFFSFKKGLHLIMKQALKLSGEAFLLSAFLLLFLLNKYKSDLSVGRFIMEKLMELIRTFSVFLCWELSYHLHEVLFTKRVVFAPPKGSAAAETNPSEPLLAALEENVPGSLLHYLSFLDLCMVCENNVDTWRRAAFFEESGETYKRVVAVCLRPLEQTTYILGEILEGSPASNEDSKRFEPLNNFQLYAWSARAISSLTARSREEDRFGVAQLWGSNATVTSTLISCLLAVEAFMGKKTNLQSPNQLMAPAGIKWAALNTPKKEAPTPKRRSGQVHSKAYAMADVLRTSIYCIISAFHDDMLASAKAGLLEKDWVVSGKPHFGSRELIVHKLRLFLDFQAT